MARGRKSNRPKKMVPVEMESDHEQHSTYDENRVIGYYGSKSDKNVIRGPRGGLKYQTPSGRYRYVKRSKVKFIHNSSSR